MVASTAQCCSEVCCCRTGTCYACFACLQPVGLHVVVQKAFFALDRAASEAVACEADAAAPQQRRLLQQLQQAARVSTGLDRYYNMGALLRECSSRLPAAAKLADLLHQWWQPDMQPERHTEAQLALAQAAATRSCAYLRCANLGSEGGPAAGEGAGSMRCRWVGGCVRWLGVGG